MTIRWRNILIAVVIIVALAYSGRIAEVLGAFPLGQICGTFTDELKAWPPLGRFVAVTAVLALLYVTVYKIALAFITRNRPPRDRPPSDRSG